MSIDEKFRDKLLNSLLVKKNNESCLEIGSGNFRQSKILRKFYNKVFCTDILKTSIKDNKIIYNKISNNKILIPQEVKDIFFIGTIEHIKRPYGLLKKILKHCKKKKSNFYLLFNNKYSLHRILGLQLGLIKNINQLTRSEKIHGHYKLYSEKYFDNLFKENNFKYKKKALFFKILPTSLIEKNFSNKLNNFYNPKFFKKYSAYFLYIARYKK